MNIDCLGVVLAGGLSSRMGTDKALLTRNASIDSNMLSFSQQLFKQAGINDVVISGQQHGLPDKVNKLGPMGGIYSVIEQYRPQAILVMPVDLPLMDHSTIAQLKLAGELSKKACFYQDNYLPLYLPVNAFIEHFFQQSFSQQQLRISNKGPSIRALLQQIPTQVLTPKNKQSLFNANTPEQWQHATTQFRKTHV
jgi:molybdopterin-guanine dinucleotide biosynthesis protein A